MKKDKKEGGRARHMENRVVKEIGIECSYGRGAGMRWKERSSSDWPLDLHPAVANISSWFLP